jgi:type I restriction enzyme S subunit
MKPWPTKPLAEVVTCLDSQRIPIKVDDRQRRLGAVPYYGANGQVGWIDEAIFDEPLLLVAEDGGHFDEPERGVAYTIRGPSWINNHVHALRPDESKVLVDFLGYHFLHFDFTPYITGTTRAKLTQSDLMRVEVPVPPLAEQERIVKLLAEADELRKLRVRADRRASSLIPALFHEMFGDPETNPKRWPRGTLENFNAEVRYGLGQPPEADPEGVPILRATNIKHGLISEEGLIRIRREAVPKSRNAFLLAEDVLVVRSGAYTGDAARVGEKWAGSVAGYDLVVSPNERLAGDFVAWFLLSKFVQEQYFRRLKTRAAQPHLNSEQVSETPFFCPPLSLQVEFAKRVMGIRELEAEQASSSGRLEGLFQSLLHRAFRGEL